MTDGGDGLELAVSAKKPQQVYLFSGFRPALDEKRLFMVTASVFNPADHFFRDARNGAILTSDQAFVAGWKLWHERLEEVVKVMGGSDPDDRAVASAAVLLGLALHGGQDLWSRSNLGYSGKGDAVSRDTLDAVKVTRSGSTRARAPKVPSPLPHRLSLNHLPAWAQLTLQARPARSTLRWSDPAAAPSARSRCDGLLGKT